jgi:hypothetical protein
MGMGYAELTFVVLSSVLVISGLCFIGSISWYLGKVWALRQVTRSAMKERRFDTNDTIE